MTAKPVKAFARAADNAAGSLIAYIKKDLHGSEFVEYPRIEGNFYDVSRDDKGQPTLTLIGVKDPATGAYKSSQVYGLNNNGVGFSTGTFGFDEGGNFAPAGFVDDGKKIVLKRGDILNELDAWRGENNQTFTEILSSKPQTIAATARPS